MYMSNQSLAAQECLYNFNRFAKVIIFLKHLGKGRILIIDMIKGIGRVLGLALIGICESGCIGGLKH